jgi:UDP-glucose 4-epimerase
MILVTGGGGYIGWHACVALLFAGEQIVVFDNFCYSSPEALNRVQRICSKPLVVVEGDIRDQDGLESVFAHYGCTAVMHFAGLKSVQDSVAQPLEYYDQNVVGSHRLLRAMSKTGVKKIVFSSSATVYGLPQFLPCTEDHPLNPTNPYGRTKLVIEDMLRDQYASDPTWRIAILRYFNPVGAHESGLIGEDPKGGPRQPRPLCCPGRDRAPATAERLWRGLRDTRWDRGQGLYSRDGSGCRTLVDALPVQRCP